MAKMHQTTVRFSDDLWALLEDEAASLGVSAAQYIRDATLARIAYNAGRRGNLEFESMVELTKGSPNPAAADTSVSESESIEAVWAQARLARARATSLRDQAKQRHRHPVPLPVKSR
jgi:hypothetical protein